MKITKILFIVLIIFLASAPTTYAMENSPKPQTNTLLDYEKQQCELFRGARELMEKNDHHHPLPGKNYKSVEERKQLRSLKEKGIVRKQKNADIKLQKLFAFKNDIDQLLPRKKQRIDKKIERLIAANHNTIQQQINSASDEQHPFHEPVEKEITNSIPVQIKNRAALLENSEKATIKIVADSIENRLNDSTPEVKVENCSVLTENAAALPPAQLAESTSSFRDSQWELFPIASNNAITNDKLGVNDDASSTINSNNSEDEVHNQLTEKRNKQIVKIAPLLIQKFNEDNAQPISVQKELTQEEIIARAHAMATTLEQSVDIFLIDVYDKYKSSIKTFKETTKEERQLFGTKSFFSSKAAPNDKFEIKDFIDKHRVDLLLCNQIKNCGLRITDPVEKMKLKNRLGIIANKSSYNCRLMETLLNSFIQKKQHQTATIISYDINMNKEESGQLFFDKIAPIIKKGNSDLRTGYWTSTKNCPQAQERSNNDFALENSIAFPQAEKYLLDQLPEHIKKTQATLATALTNAKIGF